MSKICIYDEKLIENNEDYVFEFPLSLISGRIINSCVKGKECYHIEGFSKQFILKFLSE